MKPIRIIPLILGAMLAVQAPAQNVPATAVADALDDLKKAALDKIDAEVEINARAFADAKNIHSSLFWGDLFRPFLDIAMEVYSALTALPAKNPNTVRTWLATTIQVTGAAKQAVAIFGSFDRLKQDGAALALDIDGPAYNGLVSAMLDRADATSFIFFDYVHYKQSVMNDLYGAITANSPLRVSHKSTSVDRSGGDIFNTVLAARSYIPIQFSTLSAQMRQTQLPPDRIAEMVSLIQARRQDILQSRVGPRTVTYQAFLAKDSTLVRCQVSYSLGSITQLEQWRGKVLDLFVQSAGFDSIGITGRFVEKVGDFVLDQSLDAYTETVNLNLNVEAVIAGQASANQVLKDATSLGISVAKPDIGTLADAAQSYVSSSREQINMIPQQMTDALPGEVSKLLLLVDDTVNYIQVAASAPPAPTISSLSPTTLLTSNAPQLITIYGSNFKVAGDLNASSLIFYDPVGNPYLRAPSYATTTELRYNVSVQSAVGAWTVVVTNAGQAASRPATFTVVAPPPLSYGSLIVTIQPPGALAAGAQWAVDSGAYHNNGDTVPGLTPGSHTVSFKPVAGYTAPASRPVTITGGAVTNDTAIYTAVTVATYILNINSDHGQVNRNPNKDTYSYGETVRLNVNNDTGWHFDHWSGDVSGSNSFTDIMMDGNRTVTANYAPGDWTLGAINVRIQPSEAVSAGACWKADGGDWQYSDVPLNNAYIGKHFLEFSAVPGWIQPNARYVEVTVGQTTNIVATYAATPGTLIVTLTPLDAVTAGANWHANGVDPHNSGMSISLAAGSYNVTFDSAPGWTPPISQTVTIQPGQTTLASGNYTPPAGQPVIAAIHPSFGPLVGGTELTIEGVNFTAPANVLIGGKPATSVTVLSPSQISCFTPSNLVYGTMPVVLQTPGGSATNLNGFTYGAERGNGIELVTSLGGRGYGVAVQGNYAYVGEGSSLLVVNISNPSTPALVGRLAMPGMVMDIALFGQYAYVANADAGVQVVDISNPAAPALKGFYTTPGSASGISILGGQAYVADGAGLQILGLANPTLPALLSATNLQGDAAADVVVQATTNGVFAYLSAGWELVIIEVSQPLAPVLRGHVGLESSSGSIAVSGRYAFAAFGNGIRVADVSNPDIPRDLGMKYTDVGTVTAANNLLYAIGPGGFQLFSFSGGTLSRVGANANIKSSGKNMIVFGGRAYFAGGAEGFGVVDVSNSSSPSLLSAFSDSGLYGDYDCAAVSGNYLYVGSSSGLKVFDVSKPGQAIAVGQYSAVATSLGQVLLKGGVAYVHGRSTAGITILNVSTPASPSLLTTIPYTTVSPSKIALSGNLLYIAGQSESSQPRFIAVDVSSPSSPSVRGSRDFTSFSGSANSVAVNGTKAVVGIDPSGGPTQVKVLDISDLSNPTERGTLSNVGHLGDIQLSDDGRYAFVADRDNNFRILEVSDVNNPIQVASNHMTARPWSLTVRGNVAYVAAWWPSAGIYAFDVSSPTAPSLVKSYLTPESAYGVVFANDLVSQQDVMFVANYAGGLAVLKVKDTIAPQVIITDPTSTPIFVTTTGSLNLGGAASDNVGVTRVTWSNNRGGGGDAAGTDSWFVTGITLQPGTNVLTVSAFDQAGNSGSDTLTVIYQSPKQNQSITFPAIANRTFGDAPIPLAAAASSVLPVSFSIVSGPASLSNNVLSLLGAGSVTVQANQEGNDFFNPAPAMNVSFNVAKTDQGIVFFPVPDKVAGDLPFALSATASSGLPVYFDIVSGPAVLDSTNVVTLLGGGMVTVSAWQPGNSNYNTAVTVQGTFNVARIPQSITFGPLSRQTIGDAPFPLAATASSGLPVGFFILSGPARLDGNILTVTNTGLVTVEASQSGDSTYELAPAVDQSFYVVSGNNLITDASRLPNGAFHLIFIGDFARSYVVHYSTNLIDWTPLATNTVNNLGVLEFTDQSASSRPQSFYRVKVQ